MKILKIKYENIGVFKDGLEVDFTCSDRTMDKDEVTEIYNAIAVQRVMAFVGINASGKSTVLKLINFAMDLFFESKSLDQVDNLDGIIKDDSKVTVDYYDEQMFFRIESIFGENNEEEERKVFFKEEILYFKIKSRVKSKSQIFDFNDTDIIQKRSELTGEPAKFLKKEDSIAFAYINNSEFYHMETIRETNVNMYRVLGKANTEFINLFDNSIESVEAEKDSMKVCFKSEDCSYELSNPRNAEKLLSSGTIKGGNLMFRAALMLEKGGYLLVDELEIHMHKELVISIINFFNDPEVNKRGATLIFTTHYAEILDCISRKDNIYIVKKEKNYTCAALRYSDAIKRNDIKKSIVFLSNYIKGTAPSYESIQKVRDYLCKL